MKRSNGEGTIYKRKDGRWCGAFYDESEAPKRHFVYGKTQTEVKKKIKRLLEAPILNIRKENIYTLENWMLFYLENYKKNEIKQTTFDSYMGIYRKHIQGSPIGKVKLEKLNSNDLQRFYNSKSNSGLNAKTVKHIYILINSSLNKAVQLRYVSENLNKLVVLPKSRMYNASVLSIEEVNTIFKEAKDDKLYPLIALTLCTGLRKGEIMALTWNNIDFTNRELYVTGNLCRIENGRDNKGRISYEYKIMEPKTIRSRRTIPLIEKAIEALLIQKQNQEQEKALYSDLYKDNGLVFAQWNGDFLKQRVFMDSFHDFLNRYGITNVRFHDLRHTFASLLLESGESAKVIQELLGHTNISTTMDIYAHITRQRKVKALDSLTEMINT